MIYTPQTLSESKYPLSVVVENQQVRNYLLHLVEAIQNSLFPIKSNHKEGSNGDPK